jgi:hypothetical protein
LVEVANAAMMIACAMMSIPNGKPSCNEKIEKI